MKKIFVAFIIVVSHFGFANGLNAINDPVMNPCIQRPYLSGCSGNNQSAGQARQIYKVPNRWGAIYFNAANWAIGYSENNTEGEEAAGREALANCIKAGGGKNPLDRHGEGCHAMTEFMNRCGAIALGGVMGKGGVAGGSDLSLQKAEKKALAGCSKRANNCTIRYSSCSFHPDYRR